MIGEVDKKINKIKRAAEKGITLLEALISTAIIGIGFVAVFQMVQYSVRSIDVSGERTKATYLAGMVAEDLFSDKNAERSAVKFIDYLITNPWELKNTQCGNSTPTNVTTFSKGNAVDNKTDKWTSRMSKDFLKCKDSTSESKALDMYKICHSGCPVTKTQTHDAVYVGKMELKLEGGSKTKKLYFQVN
jgi:Tfp pilus assembly protein PilV